MLHPIKIKIKAFPKKDSDFYDLDDIASPIVVHIDDYPTYISEHFKLGIMKFQHYSNAKLRINVKPVCPAKFLEGSFSAYASSAMKIRAIGVSKASQKQYATAKIKQTGTGSVVTKHGATLKTKVRQRISGNTGVKFGGIRLADNKFYMIIRTTLGYWDDTALSDMDDVENINLEGVIVH